MSTENTPDKLSLVVYDHHYDRVHYALAMAAAAAAVGRAVTVFFTMGACAALRRADAEGKPESPAWATLPLSDADAAPDGEHGTARGTERGAERDDFYKSTGIAGMEDLIRACVDFGVRFIVCEMGLRAKGLEADDLRPDIPVEIAGLVTFLDDASKDGAMVFI